MPLVPGDKVSVTFRCTYQAQRYLFTTNWQVNVGNVATTVLADLAAIGTSFGSALPGSFGVLYRACLATDLTVNEVRVQQVRPTRSVYVDTAINLNGTGVNVAGTGNTSSLLEMASAAGGRNQHSNYHIGPIPQVNIVTGSIINLQLVANQALGNFMLGTKVIGAGPLSLDAGILHPVGIVPVFDLFSVQRAQTTARVMRRRTVGVGK